MDSRIPRIRSKLAKMPYQAQRSHSVCGERHQFRLGPRISSSEADAFEAEHHILLPAAYRAFLIELGGSGAGPFYGLLPLHVCRLFTMNRKPADGSPRGFTHVDHLYALQGDLFLHIIEMGCSGLCLIGVTGPLAGRVVTGNADGFWPPNVSSAQDQRVYLITSLPPGAVTGAQLADWIRGHWKIENLLHHVRDRTFREDDSKIHVGHLPGIMAGLRNLAIGPPQDGHTNIAAALRHTARDWRRPLANLGITG